MPTPEGYVSMEVNFSDEAWSTVQNMAQYQEIPLGQVLQNAIGLLKHFQDVKDSGGRILIDRKGKIKEVEI